jgi:hypothetical protein
MSRGAALRRSTREAVERAALRRSQGQRLIFFHVPKCGGTSVREALRRSFTYYGLGEANLDPQASRRAAASLGDDLLDFRERWLAFQVERGRSHLIVGHFPFSHAVAASGEKWTLLTLLREPASQLLSEFFFNRDRKNAVHFAIPSSTKLKPWLESEAASDIGARFVEYFTDAELRRHPDTPEAIEAAKRNLLSFHALGVVEQMDAWRTQIRQVTGHDLTLAHLNISPTSVLARESEIDEEAVALAEAVVAPNRQVYDFTLQVIADRNAQNSQ